MARLTNEEKAINAAKQIKIESDYRRVKGLPPMTDDEIADMIVKEFPGHERKVVKTTEGERKE